MRQILRSLPWIVPLCILSVPAAAQFTQQGAKLVGTGATADAQQGNSVAVAADGNTAIVGGPSDNGNAGAAWIYTRTGGSWTQQGAKLVGTGATGAAKQGYSVAISADGNTAIAGGPRDNSSAGAMWVFTRSGGVWTQQGSKLVGSGAVGQASQGASVALSGDGNTAAIGGTVDNLGVGAAWVFTRSGGVWAEAGGCRCDAQRSAEGLARKLTDAVVDLAACRAPSRCRFSPMIIRRSWHDSAYSKREHVDRHRA